MIFLNLEASYDINDLLVLVLDHSDNDTDIFVKKRTFPWSIGNLYIIFIKINQWRDGNLLPKGWKGYNTYSLAYIYKAFVIELQILYYYFKMSNAFLISVNRTCPEINYTFEYKVNNLIKF